MGAVSTNAGRARSLRERFEFELLEGLRAAEPAVSPKWFYDDVGSQLFERICELDEYYPTRTELALLARHAAEFAAQVGEGVELIEFGAGAMTKVRALLTPLCAVARYVPIDISGEQLERAANELRARRPGLRVEPLVADFTRELEFGPSEGRRVGFFAGSSIGNFEPFEARRLLARMARWLRGGGLLIGVDLIKSPAVLHAAYNDSKGITAQFNLNLLARANRELGADFELAQFEHAAFYNPPEQRIEMHLISRRRQRVRIGAQTHEFDEGDSFRTEFSYKYTVEGFRRFARAAGFEPRNVWLDEQCLFALHWLAC
jgi:dimethylhistidine N-methyltransferase